MLGAAAAVHNTGQDDTGLSPVVCTTVQSYCTLGHWFTVCFSVAKARIANVCVSACYKNPSAFKNHAYRQYRKKCFSMACLCVDFPEEFLHHFVQITCFHMTDRAAYCYHSSYWTHSHIFCLLYFLVFCILEECQLHKSPIIQKMLK